MLTHSSQDKSKRIRRSHARLNYGVLTGIRKYSRHRRHAVLPKEDKRSIEDQEEPSPSTQPVKDSPVLSQDEAASVLLSLKKSDEVVTPPAFIPYVGVPSPVYQPAVLFPVILIAPTAVNQKIDGC